MNRWPKRSARLRAACAVFGGLLMATFPQVHAQSIYLLGEIHDSPQAHARRVTLIKSLVAKDPKPVIAMEQFDHDKQSALDAQTISQFGLERALDLMFEDKQRDAIDAGHRPMLPRQSLPGMVNAQIARDVWMAKVIGENSSQPVILLAGNGHVRQDIAVYYWLNESARARTEVHAYLEGESTDPASSYDQTHLVAPLERADPCAVFKAKPKVQLE